MSGRKLSRGDWRQLRQKYDGDEPLMTGGMNVQTFVRAVPRKYKMPDWFTNTDKIREFLERQFPFAYQHDRSCHCARCTFPERRLSAIRCKLNCRACRQAMTAAKWATVIQLWFVNRKSDGEIESAKGWKSGEVGSIVKKIRRVLAGDRQDGVKRTGRPRGRPKNPWKFAKQLKPLMEEITAA